jgi:RNA-binding protein YhbY
MLGKEKRALRAVAARLKINKALVSLPVSELSLGSIRSIDDTLTKHEMVMLRFNDVAKKSDAKLMGASAAASCSAELVQTVGHTGLLFRRCRPPSVISGLLNEELEKQVASGPGKLDALKRKREERVRDTW